MNKFLDQNGLLYFWNKVKNLAATKVDKVEGKGLSTNDFTDEDKAKVSDFEPYELPTASANELGGVKVGSGLAIQDGVLSATGGGVADSVAWDNITGKPDVALKSDISNVYKYKGSVENYASLPLEGNTVGDVWDVSATGMNYAWTGTLWDPLGETFQIDSITNAEIDDIIDTEE